MQLRALIKTRKRKWAMIVLGVVVCAAAVWLLLDAGHKPTDEEKFQRMVRSWKWGARLLHFESNYSWPTALRNPLQKLRERSFANSARLEQELAASGYLVSVPITNWNPQILSVMEQLGPRSSWRIYKQSNLWLVDCRSNDAPLIRAAVEKQP